MLRNELENGRVESVWSGLTQQTSRANGSYIVVHFLFRGHQLVCENPQTQIYLRTRRPERIQLSPNLNNAVLGTIPPRHASCTSYVLKKTSYLSSRKILLVPDRFCCPSRIKLAPALYGTMLTPLTRAISLQLHLSFALRACMASNLTIDWIVFLHGSP